MSYVKYIRKPTPQLMIAAMAWACSAIADVDPVAYVREELARGNSRIVVPKGVYEIEPEGSKETVYFRLSGLRDVTIDFSGSKLVGKVATRLFNIEGCTNLVLRNFTVDYAFQPFTQAVIEKVETFGFGVQADRYAGQLLELAAVVRGDRPNDQDYDRDLKTHEITLKACGLTPVECGIVEM